MTRIMELVDLLSIKFLTSEKDEIFNSKTDIKVNIDELTSITRKVEKRFPYVYVDFDNFAIKHFCKLDELGISFTECELIIKYDSEGYFITKHIYEINKDREIINEIVIFLVDKKHDKNI